MFSTRGASAALSRRATPRARGAPAGAPSRRRAAGGQLEGVQDEIEVRAGPESAPVVDSAERRVAEPVALRRLETFCRADARRDPPRLLLVEHRLDAEHQERGEVLGRGVQTDAELAQLLDAQQHLRCLAAEARRGHDHHVIDRAGARELQHALITGARLLQPTLAVALDRDDRAAELLDVSAAALVLDLERDMASAGLLGAGDAEVDSGSHGRLSQAMPSWSFPSRRDQLFAGLPPCFSKTRWASACDGKSEQLQSEASQG